MKITCHVANFKPTAKAPPPPPLVLDGKTAEWYFSNGSKGAIDLRFDVSLLQGGSALVNQQTVTDAATLSDGLTKVLGKPTPEALAGGGVSDICLIFADRAVDVQDAFGLMFDTSFVPGVQLARRGAAVFLDAIWEGRGRDNTAYSTEVVFTAIHELGHVFNLWHVGNARNPSFLTPSDPNSPYSASAYEFFDSDNATLVSEVNYLSQCATSEFVQPGGSGFGVRGGLGPSDGSNPFDIPDRRNKLRLKIRISHDRFFSFEPVELDIKLETDSATPVPVPRELDPSHSSFVIWITDPSGERRRYRPIVRYCHTKSTIKVSKSSPFERDITVFGQAGGYTFHAPGIYRIQATFSLPSGAVIRSNEFAFEVLPSNNRSAAYERILKRPAVSALLFHKCGRMRKDTVLALEEAARIAPRDRAPLIDYTLGRAFVHDSLTGSKQKRKAHWQRGSELLKLAAGARGLGAHCAKIAKSLIVQG